MVNAADIVSNISTDLYISGNFAAGRGDPPIDLTGPESENMRFYSREYPEALGRPISYQDVPVGPWRETLIERCMAIHLIDHLAAMADLRRADRYDRSTDDVLELTGRRPMSVQEFVRRRADAFTANISKEIQA